MRVGAILNIRRLFDQLTNAVEKYSMGRGFSSACMSIILASICTLSIMGCKDTGGKVEGSVTGGILDSANGDASASWSFLNSSDYTFDSNYVQVSGNKASLKTVNTTFNSSNTFNNGTYVGTTYSGGMLKLDPSTGSDTSLSPSWTPHWSNLVGYWKMDGNWLDSSGNSRTLLPTGSPTLTGVAKVGSYAGTFADGSSYATQSYANAGATSILFWAKYTGVSQEGRGVFSTDTSIATNSFQIDIGGTTDGCNGKFRFRGRNSAPADFSACFDTFNSAWNHFGVVYSSSSLKLYMNGKLIVTTNQDYSNFLKSVRLGCSRASSCWIGLIDDAAIWNTVLSPSEIALIYNRQKQKYAGSYDSPILDMGASGASWTSLSSASSLPFYKELPGSSGSESSSSYSSGSGYLMSGLIGLWHMNESSWSGLANEVADSSGSGNSGYRTGSATTSQNGKIGYSGLFSSTADSVVTKSSSNFIPSNSSPLTLSAWIYPTVIGSSGTTVIDNRIFSLHSGAGPGSTLALGLGNANKVMYYNGQSGTYFASAASISTGVWTLVTLTYDGSCFQMYVNGAIDGGCVSRVLAAGGSYAMRIGSFDSSTYNFYGKIDEAAIWNRALTASEVLELYRRGANRVKYQIRSCANSDCSDAGFIGPDGTGTTYFSELQNNTSVDSSGNPTGSVNTSRMSLDWSASGALSNIIGKPANNRYFQYRVYMESDDENSLCSSSPCMPSVSSITVGPTGRYYGGSPSIVNGTAVSYSKLKEMTRSDTGSCSTYQISTDGGSSWKWWDGAAWVTASGGVSTSNYLSDFTASRLESLRSGSYKFKAFLKTNTSGDFTQSCDLNSVSILYKK